MLKNKKVLSKKRTILTPSRPQRSQKQGSEPGTIAASQTEVTAPSQIEIMALGPNKFIEQTVSSVAEIKPHLNEGLCWINIVGLNQVAVIKELGQFFKISPLTLEDIFTTDQRPKVEDHEHYVFVEARMFSVDKENQTIKSEQVSFILGQNFIVSIVETAAKIFEPIKERVRKTNNRHERWRADFFLYSLLDVIVDHYFLLGEFLNETVTGIENQLIFEKNPNIVDKIYQKKLDVLYVRRFIWPLRECVSALSKLEESLITPQLAPYLKDLYDHVLQASENIDSYKDMLALMADFSLSISNHRINEVMKFLTIYASIFIPLTFIVGIYGMNFDYMPELKWRYGYHFVWGMMIALTLIMLYYFRRKKWL